MGSSVSSAGVPFPAGGGLCHLVLRLEFMEPESPQSRLREALARGEAAAVRRELADLLSSSHLEHVDCKGWGELCEEAGLQALARAEYRAALDKDPSDREALFRLVDLHREMGADADALRILSEVNRDDPADLEVAERLVLLFHEKSLHRRIEQILTRAEEAGADAEGLAALRAQVDLEHDQEAPVVPGDGDLIRFGVLFAGREDVHARQWNDPHGGTGYAPVRQPITLQLLRNHVLGNVTLGVYPIRLDGTVSFLALDLDLSRNFLEERRSDGPGLREARDAMQTYSLGWVRRLRELGLDPLLEESGFKGRHLWVFLADPVPASEAHALVRALALSHPPAPHPAIGVEVFPKQPGRSKDGLGNLIKLPLGTHRRTGRRSVLLGDEGEVITEPWARLRSLHRLSRDEFQALRQMLGDPPPGRGAVRSPPKPEPFTSVPADLKPRTFQGAQWTLAHFDVWPDLRHVLTACPVLGALKEKVLAGQGLTYDERMVLRHTLGHLSRGVQAFNYLLSRCGDVPLDQYLVSPLRGSPMSCARIKKRVPTLALLAAEGCSCPEADDTYSHPLLHLRELSPDETPIQADEVQVLAHACYLSRGLEDIESDEKRALESSLVQALQALPDRAITFAKGMCCRLVDEGGTTELIFEADGPEGARQSGESCSRPDAEGESGNEEEGRTSAPPAEG